MGFKNKNLSGTNHSDKIIILTCTDINISVRSKSERSFEVTATGIIMSVYFNIVNSLARTVNYKLNFKPTSIS